MKAQFPKVSVKSIRLTAFQYDIEYRPQSDAELHYDVEAMHRVPAYSETLEILIKIRYREKGQETILLSADCLTVYNLLGTKTEIDPEDGEPSVMLEQAPAIYMTHEAIIHARALVAQQTAQTPFSNTHITVSYIEPHMHESDQESKIE